MKVLLTNGEDLRTLIFLKSISSFYNIEPHVCSASRFATSFFSRHCRRRFVNASPEKNPKLFLEQIIEYTKKNNIDVLIPVNAPELEIILKNRKLFRCEIPFPEYGKFKKAKDKWRFYKLCKELNINIPRTKKISDKLDYSQDFLKNKMTYPLLIKLREGAGSKEVVMASDYPELKDKFNEFVHRFNLDKSIYPLIQEYMSGQYICVSALCDKGVVKSVFIYEICRQYPSSIGTSVCRKSIEDSSIKKDVEKILRKMKWHGIIQFDLIKKDGVNYFFDINPRLFTSLNANVVSGLNYPYYLIMLDSKKLIKNSIGNEDSGGAVENLIIPQYYSLDVESRILIMDILLFFTTLFGRSNYSLKSFFSNNSRKTYFDDVDFKDPLASLRLALKFVIKGL